MFLCFVYGAELEDTHIFIVYAKYKHNWHIPQRSLVNGRAKVFRTATAHPSEVPRDTSDDERRRPSLSPGNLHFKFHHDDSQISG